MLPDIGRHSIRATAILNKISIFKPEKEFIKLNVLIIK